MFGPSRELWIDKNPAFVVVVLLLAIVFALMLAGCSSLPKAQYWPDADVQQVGGMKLDGSRVLLVIDRVLDVLRIVPERSGSQIRIEYANVIAVDYRHAHDPDGTSKHVPVFENKEHWVLLVTATGTYALEVDDHPERLMAMLAAEGFPITMVNY